MSEYPIPISNLNDFIFCPVSIYFHGLDSETEKISYQTPSQINGTAAHKKVDTGEYSTSLDFLQSISVYSEKYNVYGKIDVFDIKQGVLRERKKKITAIYDGYIFQLYAQYYALSEMGYSVKKLVLYSYDDNKSYTVDLPQNNKLMQEKFEKLIKQINDFQMDKFVQNNADKCKHCIYEPLCSFSKCKVKI